MDFEEWMNKNYGGAFDMPHQREAYEAGQQSKQAEIDVLQKRIHDALNVFKSDLSEIGKFDTIHKILKGESK